MANRTVTETLDEESITLFIGVGPDTEPAGASFKERAHVRVAHLHSRSDGVKVQKEKANYKFTATGGVPVGDPTPLTNPGGLGGLTDQERDDLWDLLLKVWTFHKSENGFS